MLPPIFFLLPHGLSLGGVTTWAVRLIRSLRDAGHQAYLLTPGQTDALNRCGLDAASIIALGDLPPLDQTMGDLSAWIRACEPALADHCAGQTGLWLPQQLGEGISLGLALADRHDLRTIWVSHSDIPYNRFVARSLAPWLDAAVGVSDELGHHLAKDIASCRPAAHAHAVVRTIHNAVPVGDHPPLRRSTAGPLRLIAVGRVEHEPKRVLAFAHLSRELTARGIDHALTIVGDGPAMKDLQAAATPSMRITGALDHASIEPLLSEAHLFVQASRYEGLSLALLEAMAQGCVPVVAPVRSGMVVEHERSGIVASVDPSATPEQAGLALADAVQHALQIGLDALGLHAWRSVRDRFSLAQQAGRFIDLFEQVLSHPKSIRPAPPVFGSAALSTVPSDASQRALRVLAPLAGHPIALHGTGAHTRALAQSLDLPALGIIALIDDDPALRGTTRFGLPILTPDQASALGIAHVVISSHLHEQAIWERRPLYQTQGITLHRLYADRPALPPSLSDAPRPVRSPAAPRATTTASAADAADTAA